MLAERLMTDFKKKTKLSLLLFTTAYGHSLWSRTICGGNSSLWTTCTWIWGKKWSFCCCNVLYHLTGWMTKNGHVVTFQRLCYKKWNKVKCGIYRFWQENKNLFLLSTNIDRQSDDYFRSPVWISDETDGCKTRLVSVVIVTCKLLFSVGKWTKNKVKYFLFNVHHKTLDLTQPTLSEHI